MQDFGPVERERLLARFGRVFRKGEVLFREGDAATEAYLLQEGRVHLVKRVRLVERSLMVVRPNELFGEGALIDGALQSATAVALSDGSALALDPMTFRRMLEGTPSIALRVVQQLVRRLRDAEDQMEIMMLRDAQSKIVNALLKLGHAAVGPDQRSCVLTISPMDLSVRVGLDVDTVKRGVQQLRDGKYLLVVEERLELPDLEALRRLYSLLTLKDEIRGSQSSLPPPPEAPKGAG